MLLRFFPSPLPVWPPRQFVASPGWELARIIGDSDTGFVFGDGDGAGLWSQS